MISAWPSIKMAEARGREEKVLCRSSVPLAITWQNPGLTLLGPYQDLALWIVTASDVLMTFLILLSFKGLLQESTLLLLHWFESPVNSESPNYEIIDNTKGSL